MSTVDERFKRRIRKDRPMATISIRIPEDALDALKEFAPLLGFDGYEPLIRAFISEGMFKYEGKLLDAEGELVAQPLVADQAS